MGQVEHKNGKKVYKSEGAPDYGPRPLILPTGDLVWPDDHAPYYGPYGIPGLDSDSITEAYDTLFQPSRFPLHYKASPSLSSDPPPQAGTVQAVNNTLTNGGVVGGSTYRLNLSNLPPAYNPGGYDAQSVYDLINHKTGVSYIDSHYKLLNLDVNTGEIYPVYIPDNGSDDPSDISEYVQDCQVEMQTTRDVHRSAFMTIDEIPGSPYNPLTNLVQPFVTYYDSQGNPLLDVPVGILTLTIPDRDLSDAIGVEKTLLANRAINLPGPGGNVQRRGSTRPKGRHSWRIQALDMTHYIGQLSFLNNYTIPAGTSYIQAIYRILTMDNRPLGYGGFGMTPQGCPDVGPKIPWNRIQIPDVGMTNNIPTIAPMDIQFTPKDNKLNAVNQLLAAISYYPLWVDEVGVFRSAPMPYWTEAVPTPLWTYNTDINSIIIPPVAQTFPNQDQIANICEVYVENTGSAPIVSIQVNDSPSSAISIRNLGRAIVKIISDDKIPDPFTAWLRAITELQLAATLSEQVQFSTIVNPLHRVHDNFIINILVNESSLLVGDGTQEHVEYGGGNYAITTTTYPFEEISWSINMKTREQIHLCGRLIAL